LGQVIGQCEALTPAPNVLEQNTTKGEARLVFCGSRAAERRRSSYRLLYAVFVFSHITCII